jgi:hypothetical protein
VNWIIAGDICESVNQSISENKKNISPYDYVFIDSDELSDAIPNPGKNWEYNILKRQLYHPWLAYGYLNSPCLPYYIAGSMLYEGVRNPKQVHFIYADYVDYKYTTVIRSNDGSLTYQNMTTKTYHTVNRTEYYQYNSTDLLARFYEKERSDFLFLQ